MHIYLRNAGGSSNARTNRSLNQGTKLSRVFLIAEPTVGRNRKTFRLEPLNKFGTVVPIIRAGVNVRANPQMAYELVAEALKDYNPQEDYLVWAGGDTLVAVMVGVVLERMGMQSVNWLYYNREILPGGVRGDKGYYTPGEFLVYDPPLDTPPDNRMSA